jgi:uncharacterized protein
VRRIRVVSAAVLAATVIGLWATAAWAHVTVQPSSVPGGGFATISFQVPNEMDNANVNQLKVQLPQDHPFASVSVMPKAGWTYTVDKANLTTPITDDDGNTVTDYVSTITWSGGTIKPGEFDDFTISVGSLPDSGTLMFPSIQTYDNGQQVAWIEQPGPDGKEPDHPTPKLTLTAADETNGTAAGNNDSDAAKPSGSVAQVTTTLSASAPVAAASTDPTSSSNGLAIAAIVVAALALVAAVFAIIAGRAKPAGASSGSSSGSSTGASTGGSTS